MRATRCLAAALAVSLLVTTPALARTWLRHATAPRVRMQAEAGFSSYAKARAWIPLRIWLRNEGDTDIEGEVSWTNTSRAINERYAQPVLLPVNSRRLVTLYVPAEKDSFDIVLRAGERVIATAEALIRRLDSLERLILVVSDTPDALNFLGSIPSPVRTRSTLAFLRPDQLPDRSAALDSADVLIFHNTDTTALSDAQREAVRAWVLAGGHLVLSGGLNAVLSQSGFTDIAPARAGSELLEVSLSDVAAFVGLPVTTSSTLPLLVAPLKSVLASAHILARSSTTPLIVRQSLGRGIVDQLAFDVTLEPLRSWPGRTMLFMLLFGGRAGWPLSIGLDEGSGDIAAETGMMLPRGLYPSPLLVLVLFIAYALLIGPVNWAVLRARGKLEWAWITTPALAAAFTALALLTGFRPGGNRPILHRLSTHIGSSGSDTARAMTLYAALSPRQENMTLTLRRASVRPLAEPSALSANTLFTVTLRKGEPDRMLSWQLSNQHMELAYALGTAPHPLASGKLEFAYDPNSGNAILRGQLINESDQVLSDCSLLVAHDYAAVGDLAPRASTQASITLTATYPQSWFDLREINTWRPETFASLFMWQGRINLTPSTSWRPRPPNSASLPSTSAATDSEPSLWRRSFDIAEAALGWVDVNLSDTTAIARQAARVGLARSIFGNMGVGVGAFLACWSDTLPNSGDMEPAEYVDRGMHLWRVPVLPFDADEAGLPPSAYSWSLLYSDGFWLENEGFQLGPGDHLLMLEPWFEVYVSPRTATAKVALSWANAPSPTVQAFSWRKGDFDAPLPLTLSPDKLTELPLHADHIHQSGRMLLRLRIPQRERITLRWIAPSVRPL